MDTSNETNTGLNEIKENGLFVNIMMHSEGRDKEKRLHLVCEKCIIQCIIITGMIRLRAILINSTFLDVRYITYNFTQRCHTYTVRIIVVHSVPTTTSQWYIT